LANVRAKFQSGVGNKADVEQASARLALAQSTLTAREGGLLEAIARYERLVGETPPGELAVPSAPPSGLVRDGLVDQAELQNATAAARERALDEHPAVLQSEADVAAAQAAVKGATA